MKKDSNNFYTLAQTAKILGKSRTAVQNEISRQERGGKVNYPSAKKVYIKPTWLISHADIEAILRRQGIAIETRLFNKNWLDTEIEIQKKEDKQ